MEWFCTFFFTPFLELNLLLENNSVILYVYWAQYAPGYVLRDSANKLNVPLPRTKNLPRNYQVPLPRIVREEVNERKKERI